MEFFTFVITIDLTHLLSTAKINLNYAKKMILIWEYELVLN